ncbi:TasA family protein [Neobacillus sp. YIM B06451]|uniref:TasA family protein n=1 Tax=Neobacillus sp. YIM B06451 TaxID=3070994 RepID=UPI00292D6CA7|nr:TasA family protein [Neobacillus sp. YIM B06451]
MSIKKKMSMGIMAGALGISLIGGGTWAAFNDVEEISNSFASGTLDLTTNVTTLFDISNLKPGDSFSRDLVLGNKGSLAINDILMTTTVDGWEDKTDSRLAGGGVNTLDEFLSQFEVIIKRDSTEIFKGTLKGLKDQPANKEVSGTDEKTAALAPNATSTYNFYVKFIDDQTYESNSRFLVQNKYQGEGATVKLMFEATQMKGEIRSNN